MQAINGAGSKGLAARFRTIFAAGLLGLAGLWPVLAMAQTSTYCPTPLTATVAWGGSVAVDVSNCDGDFDGGMSGPIAPFAAHGTVTIGPNSGNVQFVTYAHNGSTPVGGGSDTIWLEDNDLGTVRINLTISAPTSPITVSPATLPTLTAGSVFSQTLASAGGTSPYSYTLQGGVLPVGLSLTSAGVLSGTPTQRGGYSFSVRSTDNMGQTADKGYTGTVQNPTLTLTSVSGTAIQGVPFSQTLSTTGGVAPHTYQLESGTLPAGISISSAGVVSGITSAAAASYPVTLRVTDASTGPGSYFELENYTLTVSPPPSVSIAVMPASVSEDGATNLVYTVTRSLNLSSSTVVNLSTSGTATSGTDYTGAVSTVTIPAGATSATVTINPTTDGSVEADETVILTVAAGTGYTVGAPASITGTILNDDVPSATIGVSPASVLEDGAPNLIYTVSLNQTAVSATTVNFTVSGTATSGSDFAAVGSSVVIPAGNTTATVTVNPSADTAIEADETVTLTLGAGVGYTVGVPASATGTIANDDAPSLSIGDVTLGEAVASFPFTVTLSAPAGPGGVTFDIATANDTAIAGLDYTATTVTGLTIPAGQTVYTFNVPVAADTLNEPDETFFVNITNITNAVAADVQAVGTISNDDPLPIPSIADASVVEGNAGTTSLDFTVTLNAASGQTVTLQYATADGSAYAPGDYVAATGTLTFAPGQTSRTVSVTVKGDTMAEVDEMVVVNIGPVANAGMPADGQAFGTITNDDADPVISVGAASVVEGTGAPVDLVFPVTLSAASSKPVGVAYFVNDGTAIAPDDFTAINGLLTFNPGETSKNIVVQVAGDALSEATETVRLSLGGESNATLAGSLYEGTIVDNDAAPGVSVDDAVIAEGNTGPAPLTFTISLAAASGQVVSVNYVTTNGTAIQPGDYQATSGSLTFSPGETMKTVAVNVQGDVLSEANETFELVLSNPVNAVLTDSRGLGTITNDDPLPSLSIASPSFNEGNAGTRTEAVTVTLGAPSEQTVTVNYVTADGTATAGSDYQAGSGTLTFAPGVTSQVIGVGVTGDTVPEANETFTVGLSGAVNASIGTATGAVTLLNDDVPVTVSPATVPDGTVAVAYSQSIAASGGVAPYTFALTAGTLPPGLSLTSGGLLAGTPTASGAFNFAITASDSSPVPGPFTGSQAYTLVVGAPTIALPATTLAGGTPGLAYSASITAASGGTAPYAYALTAGALPPGLALNAATGAITGTPTALGTFSFSITATDSSTGTGPFTATQSYSIAVTDTPPVAGAVSVTVAYGSAGNPVVLNITGGAPTSVAIATAPAHGAAIATGTSVTYTPAAGYAGPDSFTYTATNSGGTSAPGTVSVTVADPVVTITAGSPLSAAVSSPYSQTFTFNGGAQPWGGYQVTNLPAGLALTGFTANTVTVSGTPTEAGTFALNVSATDSSTGSGPYSVGEVFTLTVAAPTLTLVPGTGTLAAPYAAPFSQTFTAGGGVGPYAYAVTGTVPAGLSLSGGTLAGTPTVPGSYPITITATDASTGAGAPFSITQSYTIDVAGPAIAISPATLPAPVAAVAYSQSLAASGGVAPYGFAVTAGNLPTGLGLASNGALTGTPKAAGTFNFTVTATDAHGQTGSQAYTLSIAVPTLAMAPAAGTLTLAYAAPYTQAFTASGGSGSFSYALTGALPAGVSFSGNTLSGTPTVPGSYAITVTATDSLLTGVGAPYTVAHNYTLDVPAPAIVVDPATLPGTTAGLPYSQSITAAGGAAPYGFAVTAGALPDGLSLASGGALSGTSTTAGTFHFTVTVTDAHGQAASQAYTVTVAVPTLALTPATLPDGVAGTAYNQVLTITGGIAPYTVVQAGALPAGLSFNAATRTFNGTPTQSGSFNISVTVTDSTGGTAASLTQAYTLTVAAPTLSLTPASLPNATAGSAYSQAFVASGGIAPYTYAISAGAAPTGLLLNATTGALDGTPTAAGTFTFSVTATDSTTGTAAIVTQAYTLTVSAPSITVNPPVLPGGTVGVPYTHVLNAIGGTAPYTFAVTAGALPGGLTLAADGRISGEPAPGGFAFTVTATDALGFTGSRAYTVQVVERPDPSRDPEVRGLLEAQADSARRFASAQMGNVHQRLENLHDNREGMQLSNRLSFATSQKCDDYLGRKPGEPCTDRVASSGSVATSGGNVAASSADSEGEGQGAGASPFATWIGGVIRSGNQDGRGGGARVDFETDGVSIGADRRFGPAFALGAGLGYGRDKSDVGDNGSRVEGDAYAMVLYASYHPGDRYFVDALAGYQRLSYDLRRRVTGTDGFAYGTRDGDQWFGSVSAGAQFQRQTWQLTPYARLDVSQATLDAYVEQGDPVYSLAYGEQDVDATTGNLGLRVESRQAKPWGVFAPQARLEYQHDFNGDSSATLQYADLLTGPLYRAELVGFDRSRFMVGVGAMFYLARDFTLRAEYRGLFGNGGDRDNGLMLNFEKSY